MYNTFYLHFLDYELVQQHQKTRISMVFRRHCLKIMTIVCGRLIHWSELYLFSMNIH